MCRETDVAGVSWLPSSPDVAECCEAYRYVSIDNPPSLGLCSICGMTAARSLAIPIQREYLAWKD